MGAVRAIAFDFNGTLSDDEPLLCAIFRELFAARGRPLTEQEYYDELAGLSDEAIVTRWLGDDYPDVAATVSERVARYRALSGAGSTVPAATRDAVRYAARRVPLAVVSGAARSEIEPVLVAAGLTSCFRAIVAADDVHHGKPHPEGYTRALETLGVLAGDALAFEDTEAGVAAATTAGLRCVAVGGTLAPGRLARAEAVVATIDRPLLQALLEQR